ncbi:MAG: alpha/beta hydrolase [Lachnospiraceae bacterium]|nr:alpha/beta hydrolase [Lachnospiraceae bacterium]
MLFSKEQLDFTRDGKRISGELLLPDGSRPFPLVILSHALGATRETMRHYAEAFAGNGIASYIFDFIGGGSFIGSDGKTTEMSVLTEACDLNVILDGLRSRDDMDKDRIFLCGGSQGGFVSTYIACKRPEDIAGLIPLYPAYIIHDDCRMRHPDPEDIPETEEILGVNLGRIYTKDALSFDIFDMMKDYKGKVLIIHGDRDLIEPLSYSEKAVKLFPDARLEVIKGADHGFIGEQEEQAVSMAADFIKGIIQADRGI